MDYYDYYYEAYEAVLGGMVGEYEIEQENESGEKIWKKCTGLKHFHQLQKGLNIMTMTTLAPPEAMDIKGPISVMT